MKPNNANWIITGAGWYAEDNEYVLFVIGPNDDVWTIPTDEATVKTLQDAGMPEQNG